MTRLSDEVPASTAVILALAEAEDVDPAELEAVLYERINPDALDALIAGSEDVTVELFLAGYHVVVRGTGEIELRNETESGW